MYKNWARLDMGSTSIESYKALQKEYTDFRISNQIPRPEIVRIRKQQSSQKTKKEQKSRYNALFLRAPCGLLARNVTESYRRPTDNCKQYSQDKFLQKLLLPPSTTKTKADSSYLYNARSYRICASYFIGSTTSSLLLACAISQYTLFDQLQWLKGIETFQFSTIYLKVCV